MFWLGNMSRLVAATLPETPESKPRTVYCRTIQLKSHAPSARCRSSSSLAYNRVLVCLYFWNYRATVLFDRFFCFLGTRCSINNKILRLIAIHAAYRPTTPPQTGSYPSTSSSPSST